MARLKNNLHPRKANEYSAYYKRNVNLFITTFRRFVTVFILLCHKFPLFYHFPSPPIFTILAKFKAESFNVFTNLFPPVFKSSYLLDYAPEPFTCIFGPGFNLNLSL